MGSFYQQIEAQGDKLPPVQNWNPPLSGEMDCLIEKDGSWKIDGTELQNPRLQRLLSKVLKFEDGEYYLVSPVEKWRIEVVDLPFLVVELDVENAGTAEQSIRARTNVGDWVQVDKVHRLGTSPMDNGGDIQIIPFLAVRDMLKARFNRTTFLELANLLEPAKTQAQYKILSSGETFTLNLDD